MTNDQFLASLQRSALLPNEVIESLRGLINDATGEVQPRHLAKWLVDNKHLTPFQAKELLAGKTSSVAAASKELQLADDLQIVDDDEEAAEDELEEVDDEELEVVDDDEVEEEEEEYAEEDDLEEVEDEEEEEEEEPEPPPRRAGGPARATGPRQAGSRDVWAPEPQADALSAPPRGPAAGARPSIPRTPVRTGRVTQPAPKKGMWDSPLMLIGGGTLVLLLIAAPILYLLINRRSGDEMFDEAESAYKNGAYVQAVNVYDQYLEKNPDHKSASVARVHRALARMRQVVDSTSDWPRALEGCKKMLEEISSEKDFQEGHAELGVMLPKIAEGLASRAMEKPQRSLVAQSREALALTSKHVPKSLRPDKQMEETEKKLLLAEHELNRGDKLQQALTAIKEAVDAGKTVEAYRIRHELVRVYPELVTEATLNDAVSQAVQAERATVKFVAESQPAVTDEPASGVAATLVLAAPALRPLPNAPERRPPGTVPGADGKVAVVMAESAVYGLDAASGRVLWRRFVGYETRFPPTRLAEDVIVVASAGPEQHVLRLQAASGRLVWRQTLKEQFTAAPLALGGRLMLPARSGRLVLLDAETGAYQGYVGFTQALNTGPATDFAQRRLYQLGEQSNLYVLSAEPATFGQCDEVIFLGHEAGSVQVPPAVMGRYFVVAENAGLQDSVLRVFQTDENGANAKPVQQLSLQGQVRVPPLLVGRVLMVVTDRGGLYSFEVSTKEQGETLNKIAQKAATGSAPVDRYVFANLEGLWVGDAGLKKYDVQAARGEMPPKWTIDAQDVVLQPLQAAGEAVIHVRRRSGFPGAAVSAVRMDTGDRIWETHLAAPLAGAPLSDGKSLSAVTVLGELFHQETVPSAATAALAPVGFVEVDQPLPQGNVVGLAGGMLAFAADSGAGGAKKVLVYNPKAAAAKRLAWFDLPDALASAPLSLGGKLLAPGKIGQVYLLDPRGKKGSEVAPFQPRLDNAGQVAWRALAALSDSEALLTDGSSKLYRLKVVDQPQPHLDLAGAPVDVGAPIAAPAVIAGELAFVIDAGNRMQALRAGDLTAVNQWPLEGHWKWGPKLVGGRVLAATEENQLLCWDQKPQVAWKQPLTHGAVAGAVAADDQHLVVSYTDGVVATLSADSGQETGAIVVHEFLMGDPLLADGRLFVAGRDGCLHLLNQAE